MSDKQGPVKIGADGELESSILWEENKPKRGLPIWGRLGRHPLVWTFLAQGLCLGSIALAVLIATFLAAPNVLSCSLAKRCSAITVTSPALADLQSTASVLGVTQTAVTSQLISIGADTTCDSVLQGSGSILSYIEEANDITTVRSEARNLMFLNLDNQATCAITNFELYGKPIDFLAYAWSLDRQHLITTCSGICEMDWNGRNSHVMAETPGFTGVTNVDWSPDNTHLVVSYEEPQAGNCATGCLPRIYIMDADGSHGHWLSTTTNDTAPRWSPDGKQIVFISVVWGTPQLFIASADGSNRRQLTTGDYETADPDWSPDGKLIAFASYRDGNEDIYVMNADGSNEQRLTTNPNRDDQPAWSPDGKFIAFRSFRDQVFEIYVMNADGSNQHRVTLTSSGHDLPRWYR